MEEENKIDYRFGMMAVNNAIAALKSLAEDIGDGDQLELQSAITSLFIARKWINRAEAREARNG